MPQAGGTALAPGRRSRRAAQRAPQRGTVQRRQPARPGRRRGWPRAVPPARGPSGGAVGLASPRCAVRRRVGRRGRRRRVPGVRHAVQPGAPMARGPGCRAAGVERKRRRVRSAHDAGGGRRGAERGRCRKVCGHGGPIGERGARVRPIRQAPGRDPTGGAPGPGRRGPTTRVQRAAAGGRDRRALRSSWRTEVREGQRGLAPILGPEGRGGRILDGRCGPAFGDRCGAGRDVRCRPGRDVRCVSGRDDRCSPGLGGRIGPGHHALAVPQQCAVAQRAGRRTVRDRAAGVWPLGPRPGRPPRGRLRRVDRLAAGATCGCTAPGGRRFGRRHRSRSAPNIRRRLCAHHRDRRPRGCAIPLHAAGRARHRRVVRGGLRWGSGPPGRVERRRGRPAWRGSGVDRRDGPLGPVGGGRQGEGGGRPDAVNRLGPPPRGRGPQRHDANPGPPPRRRGAEARTWRHRAPARAGPKVRVRGRRGSACRRRRGRRRPRRPCRRRGRPGRRHRASCRSPRGRRRGGGGGRRRGAPGRRR